MGLEGVADFAPSAGSGGAAGFDGGETFAVETDLGGVMVLERGSGVAAAAVGTATCDAVTWAPAPLGQMNCPFWLRTTLIFSLSDILPSNMLIALQQATQLSSLLLPARDDGTRCSTLASALERGMLQKKQLLPCANINRSIGFVGIYVQQGLMGCGDDSTVPLPPPTQCYREFFAETWVIASRPPDPKSDP